MLVLIVFPRSLKIVDSAVASPCMLGRCACGNERDQQSIPGQRVQPAEQIPESCWRYAATAENPMETSIAANVCRNAGFTDCLICGSGREGEGRGGAGRTAFSPLGVLPENLVSCL